MNELRTIIMDNVTEFIFWIALALTIAFVFPWLRSKIKNEKWLAAIDKLTAVASVAVAATEQQLASKLRADPSTGEGKLSDDQARQAAAHAMDLATQQLGASKQSIKSDMKIDDVQFDATMRAYIESAVRDLKLHELAVKTTTAE